MTSMFSVAVLARNFIKSASVLSVAIVTDSPAARYGKLVVNVLAVYFV